jgi:paraquat-inducible protein A
VRIGLYLDDHSQYRHSTHTMEHSVQSHLPVPLRDKIVCPHCDGYYRTVALKPGEFARCPDCRGILQRHKQVSTQLVLSAALSGAIFVLIALTLPVLTTSFGGIHNNVNLLSAPDAFGTTGYEIPAYVTAIVSVAAPFAQCSMLTWLLSFALAGRRAPGFSFLLRILHVIRPWAMLEVFFLGSLIVVVKVSGWVSVHLGPGMWSLAAFSALLIAVHRFESSVLWSREDLR